MEPVFHRGRDELLLVWEMTTAFRRKKREREVQSGEGVGCSSPLGGMEVGLRDAWGRCHTLRGRE